MATLTADDITYVRMMSGDTCPDEDVTDTFMQWLYDNKVPTKPLCMSDDPLAGLIVWVLKARVAKAQRLFDEDGENGARRVSQKRGFLEKDLATWKDECGLGGSLITIGTLDLGIDRDCSTAEYAAWGREYGWAWGYFG